MANGDKQPDSGESLSSDAMVASIAEVTSLPAGRSRSVRTFVTDHAVLTVIERGESPPAGPGRQLAGPLGVDGEAGAGVDHRARLTSVIEALAGARVTAVLTGSQPDAGRAFELYLLED